MSTANQKKEPIASTLAQTRKGPWRRGRIILAAIAMLAICFVGINAVAAVQAWRLTRFTAYGDARPIPEKMSLTDKLAFMVSGGYSPRSRLGAAPEFPVKDIKVTTRDGLALAGWESLSPPGTTATIILCHGHGASRSSVLSEAEVFHEMGFRVVMFDFRAHGKSDGQICSVGYNEAEGVQTVWNYVSKTYPDEKVFLYGISMGAVAVARAVSMAEQPPAAVLLDMPFNRLLDAVRSRVRLMGLPAEPAASLLTFWGGVELGIPAFNFSTADYIATLNCPILLQWGTKDNRVSHSEIAAIRQAAPTGLLTFHSYRNLGHASLCSHAKDQWVGHVTDFLRKCSRVTPELSVATAR